MDLKTHIGLRVKSARNRAGFTQAQLAEKLDRAVETISNIERGQALPGLEMLGAISAITNVPIADFLDGYDLRRKVTPARQALELRVLETASAMSDAQLQLALRLLRAISG